MAMDSILPRIGCPENRPTIKIASSELRIILPRIRCAARSGRSQAASTPPSLGPPRLSKMTSITYVDADSQFTDKRSCNSLIPAVFNLHPTVAGQLLYARAFKDAGAGK